MISEVLTSIIKAECVYLLRNTLKISYSDLVYQIALDQIRNARCTARVTRLQDARKADLVIGDIFVHSLPPSKLGLLGIVSPSHLRGYSKGCLDLQQQDGTSIMARQWSSNELVKEHPITRTLMTKDWNHVTKKTMIQRDDL